MKSSSFNYLVERDDGRYLAFNSASGAMAVISEKVKQVIDQVEDTTDQNYLENEVMLNLLKDTGFIVDSALDEVKEVRTNMEARKHDLSILGLTIMPTSTCNLECVYCYEKTHASTMTDATIDELIAFADERMATVKHLAVTWYGGEPLVAIDQIETISHRLKALCKKHGAEFSAGAITNGTLLTEDVARRLVDTCGVSYCQVTLDGPAHIHDKRRPYRGMRGSFETIVNNIKAVNHLLDINVRVNVDKENVENLYDLLDYLADQDLQDKIKIHIGLTEPLGEVQKCPDLISKCLDDEILPHIQVDFYKEALKRGFKPQFYLVPANVFGLCAAEIINSFVVEPNGDLQKCWVTVGHPGEAVGNVRTGLPASAKLQEWVGFDPLLHKECRECKELPLCWGNCVYRNRGEETPQCGMWKYKLDDVLSEIETFEETLLYSEDRGSEDNAYVIRPTVNTRTKEADLDDKFSLDQDIDWLYAGRANRRRCCFIVCVRCSHLAVKCPPIQAGCNPVHQS